MVTYDGGGVLDYTYSDGSKISVGNTIASVYSSEDAVTAKNKIKILESEIAALERAQNPGTTNYVQPETLKSKIDKEYKELLSYSSQDKRLIPAWAEVPVVLILLSCIAVCKLMAIVNKLVKSNVASMIANTAIVFF